jgi:hypothetical protein
MCYHHHHSSPQVEPVTEANEPTLEAHQAPLPKLDMVVAPATAGPSSPASKLVFIMPPRGGETIKLASEGLKEVRVDQDGFMTHHSRT